jgi:hypothetical protein
MLKVLVAADLRAVTKGSIGFQPEAYYSDTSKMPALLFKGPFGDRPLP